MKCVYRSPYYYYTSQRGKHYRYYCADLTDGWYTMNVQKRIIWNIWKFVYVCEERSFDSCVKKCEAFIANCENEKGC